MKILKLIDVYIIRTSTHMLKIVKINMYSCISAGLSLEYPSHRYPTCSRGEFVLPFRRTITIKISHKYQLLSIWGAVPPTIKDLNRLYMFKKIYNEHLISEYQYYPLFSFCPKALNSKWLALSIKKEIIWIQFTGLCIRAIKYFIFIFSSQLSSSKCLHSLFI